MSGSDRQIMLYQLRKKREKEEKGSKGAKKVGKGKGKNKAD